MSSVWNQHVTFMLGKGNLDELIIISAENGEAWASSSETFCLREYSATIVQEDGDEKEEEVNEAKSILKFMTGVKHSHGIRLNGGRKMQVLRHFQDDDTKQYIVYCKMAQGGACVAGAGKCVLIGTFNEQKGQTSSGCNNVIENMAKYYSKSEWPSKDDISGAPTWQQYVDVMMVGKGNVSKAMVVSLEGKALAATPEFELLTYETEIVQEDGTDKLESVDEAKNLLMAVKGTKPTQGLRISEVKFQILRSFEENGTFVVLGKKMKGGCVIISTSKAILVATFDEMQGHTSSGCNIVLSDLATYLATAEAPTQ